MYLCYLVLECLCARPGETLMVTGEKFDANSK